MVRAAYTYFPLVLLALLWEVISRSGVISQDMLPPFSVVMRALWGLIQSGDLLSNGTASLTRAAIGFVLAVGVGALLGAGMALIPWVYRGIDPIVQIFYPLPKSALIPLVLVWFGLGDAAKVAFLSLAAFFPVVLNTFEGIRSVPPEWIEVGRVFGFSRWQMLRRVVLPSALPSVFAGIHLGLIYAWLATLGAEYLLVSGQGIGNTLIDGRENFQMDLVLFGVIVVGSVGFVLNWIASQIEHRLLAWRGRSVAQYG